MSTHVKGGALDRALDEIAIEFGRLPEVYDEWQRFVRYAVDTLCSALIQPTEVGKPIGAA